MFTVAKNRLWLCLGLALVFSLIAIGSANASLFGIFKSRKKVQAAAITEALVIFPFDLGETSKVPATFGEDLASALRTMLSDNGQYWIYFYRDRLAPIKRAKDDNVIKPQEATGPFASEQEKCLKLARLLAADAYVTGSIEDYEIDDTKKIAQITVSVSLVDTKSGKVVKTLLVAGRTPDNSTITDEDEVRALAGGDAISKLKAQLMAETTAKPGETKEEPTVKPEPPAAQAVK